MNAGRNPDKKSRQRSDSSTESSTDKKSPEYNVLVMFSPYSMEDLKYEAEVHLEAPQQGGINSSKLTTTLICEWTDHDKGKKKYDKIIFVDCSDIMFKLKTCVQRWEKVWYQYIHVAVTELRLFCIEKKIKGVQEAHVTLAIAAYHPCEHLLFTMAKQVENKSLEGDTLYDEFMMCCYDEIARADNLVKRMQSGWSFDLGYCALFMGSLFVADQKPVKERVDYLNKLWDIFYNHEIGPERGGRNYIPDFQWEKKTGGDKIARYYEKPDGTVTFDIVLRLPYNGKMLDWEQVEYLKHLAEDEAWWQKYNELKYEKASAYGKSGMLYDQALDAEAAFKRTKKDLEPQLKEIRKKLAILEKRKDKNSYEYKVWKMHEEDISPEGQVKTQFYDIDTIEYNGKHWKEKALRAELARLEGELAKGQKEVEALFNASDQVLRDFAGKWIHLGLAVFSLIPSPISPLFALLDAAYEIYEMNRDGESLNTLHALSIGIDCLAIIPVFGGAMKIVSGNMSYAAKAAQATEKIAAAQAKTLKEALETSLKAGKYKDYVIAGAKARKAGATKEQIIKILKEEIEKTPLQGGKSAEELSLEIKNAVTEAKRIVAISEQKFRVMGIPASSGTLKNIEDLAIKLGEKAKAGDEGIKWPARLWTAVMGVGVNSYCLFNGDPVPAAFKTKTEDDYRNK